MNQKKKILIVSASFYPQNSPRSFRTTELTKEFARQGHQVTVITPRVKEHRDLEQEHEVQIKDLGPLKWKSIDLKGSGLNLLFRRAFIRISNLLFEYPHIELVGMVKRALKGEQNYDALISIAVPYPVHWGVASIWSKDSKKNPARVWIADCGDPYMGQENDTFKKPFYFRYIEKWFMRKTDYITVPTHGSIQGYYPEFLAKIKVIPQGFRFEAIQKYQGKKIKPYPVFAYAGMFIPGRRDPSEFLNYLCSLNLEYEFHIYTRSTQLVEPFLKRSNGRIQIKELLPRENLLYELSKMDFMVNFENAGSKQTPSKLIDYTIIEKPILSIETGNLNIDVIDEFIIGNYKKAKIIEDPDQYRIENVCREFLSLI